MTGLSPAHQWWRTATQEWPHARRTIGRAAENVLLAGCCRFLPGFAEELANDQAWMAEFDARAAERDAEFEARMAEHEAWMAEHRRRAWELNLRGGNVWDLECMLREPKSTLRMKGMISEQLEGRDRRDLQDAMARADAVRANLHTLAADERTMELDEDGQGRANLRRVMEEADQVIARCASLLQIIVDKGTRPRGSPLTQATLNSWRYGTWGPPRDT